MEQFLKTSLLVERGVGMTGEEIAAQFAEHENRIKVSEHRIRDLEESQKQIYDLTISVKELAISVKSMVSEQKEQGERIKKLEEQPAEKWNTLQKTILTSIISTVVGAVLSALFLL